MQERIKPSKETIEMWHNDSNNWKLGLFYFNKNDNRIFVSKRISMLGVTLNFAKQVTWLFVIALSVSIILYIIK